MSEVVCVVLTTAPSETVANQLAESLVEERLAACVHILPQGRSIYLWEGEIHRDLEWSLIIKTSQAGYPALEERLQALHPYEIPEILAIEVEAGHAPYLAWLRASVGQSN